MINMEKMKPHKGKRQTDRSRRLIKEALQKLLRSKNYGEISVGELVKLADVGRSTFYRHFKGKADVMIDLHRDMFMEIFGEMDSPDKWMSGSSTRIICRMFTTHLNSPATKTSFAENISTDLDYIMRGVIELLGKSIESGLQNTFTDSAPKIPFAVTASAIAGIYSMTFMSWKSSFPEIESEQLAAHVQSLISAVIQKSITE